MRWSVCAALLVAAAAAGPGCYRYSAADLDRLEPGSEVRMRVTAEEVERFRAQIPEAGPVVEGRFLSRSGDRLLVAVPIRSEVRGMRVETLHQRVALAAPAVLALEVRELDRRRTLLLVGAGIAAVAAVVVPRFVSEGGSGRDEGTPPAEARVHFRPLLPAGQ